MNTPDDIVREFLVESYENLERLDRDLLALEKNPGDVPTLSSVFRTIHTIKGTCGFLGFSKLESVSHVGESLLSKLRDGHLTLNPPIATALLMLVDAVREMLASVEQTGAEGDGDYTALVAELKTLHDSDGVQAEDDHAPAAAPVAAPAPAAAPAAAAPAPKAAEPAPAPKAAPKAAAPAGEHGGLADTTIRVDVSVLDKLMTLVGELVLTRNQLIQFGSAVRDPAFARTTQRLNLITGELQQGVMKTRMQPVGNVFDRFPRVVRDLSAMVGKRIRLEVEGGETELDRSVIEAIKDPLTHIVRNSVDHGIEKPDARTARGKPAEGVLRLRAFHEGGQVNIEIADDGGGIPPDRVKAKAVEKGLITAEQAARMTDREAIALIFAPGFSTAEQVTNISGRGVGMDVVRTNVEKVGGTLDVTSTVGVGTTIRVTIPLTLAIVPALIVTCDQQRYAIPQVNLIELVRTDGEVERVHGSPVFRLRGRLLPLVYLREWLDRPPADPNEPITIAVLTVDGRQFGVVLDAVLDTQEIVVKPLARELQHVGAYAGATVLGDGRVALILDAAGLASASGIPKGGAAPQADKPSVGRVVTLLLLELGGGRRLALPMSNVRRLEEVLASGIERIGGLEVLQYRGDIMPLYRLAHLLGEPESSDARTLQVAVYAAGGRTVGLVADRVVDIVETELTPHRTAARPGVPGTAVILGRVTELVEVEELLSSNGLEVCR